MIARESLDGVSICGHVRDHLPMVKAIAPTGVHLFFDKPVAMTLEETDEIVGLIHKHSNRSGACQPARYDDAIRKAKCVRRRRRAGRRLDSSGVFGAWRDQGTGDSADPATGRPFRVLHIRSDPMVHGLDSAEERLCNLRQACAGGFAARRTARRESLSWRMAGLGRWISIARRAGVDRSSKSKLLVRTALCAQASQWRAGTLFTKDGNTSFQHDQNDSRRVHFNELSAWASAVERGEDCELPARLARKVMELCVAWKLSSDERRFVDFPG